MATPPIRVRITRFPVPLLGVFFFFFFFYIYIYFSLSLSFLLSVAALCCVVSRVYRFDFLLFFFSFHLPLPTCSSKWPELLLCSSLSLSLSLLLIEQHQSPELENDPLMRPSNGETKRNRNLTRSSRSGKAIHSRDTLPDADV